MVEMNAINENEKEIYNNLLYGEYYQESFQNYYVLNKTWFDKYKISLKAKNNNNNLFTNIQEIFPFAKSKYLTIKEIKNYSYPSNFIIANQKVFNHICKHFHKSQTSEINNLSYEVLIFGKCLIIKSHLNPYMIYVSIFKENNINGTNYENEIRYIFEFNSEKSMSQEIQLIKTKGFFN